MPDRPHAHRGAPFETLFEAPASAGPTRGGDLPPGLRRYGPRLAIPLRPERPTVVVNFVESLDGVVTLDPEHGSGAEVSGFSEADRFVMGLLRSVADAIVVGAGTVRAAARHAWTPEHVNRDHAGAYAAWRTQMGLAPVPILIVVSAAGDVPAAHPALAIPGARPIVVTSAAGAARARGALPPEVRVVSTGGVGAISAAAILDVAAGEGASVVLCEGGPHLMATFVEGHLVDELFLTIAPQLVGRGPGDGGRFGLVEGVALDAEAAPWGRLRSVLRSEDHLFLRYAFGSAPA